MNRWTYVLLAVGAPLLALLFLAVLRSVLFDVAALVSVGWIGVAVLAAWLVGFPLYAWRVTRHDPPRF